MIKQRNTPPKSALSEGRGNKILPPATMEFEIGQTVYHKASAEQGIVIDIRIFKRINFTQYNVAHSFDNSSWCDEIELTEEKPIF